MTLLREIQQSAVDGEARLADLLRKSLLLAVRLQSAELEEWVRRELNGYPSDAPLPSYRVFEDVHSVGLFNGGFGTTLTRPLPLALLPEGPREDLALAKCRHAIAVYESLVESGANVPDGELRARWPPNLVAAMQARFIQGMALQDAWQVLAPGAVVGLLDAVRNRILDFAIRIEAENPDAGETEPDTPPPIPLERVTNIYNTVIHGGTNVISGTFNQTHTQSLALAVGPGDLSALRRVLGASGLSAEEAKRLESIVVAEPKPEGKDLPARAKEWLAKAGQKAASEGWDVAKKLVVEALLRYYGLK